MHASTCAALGLLHSKLWYFGSAFVLIIFPDHSDQACFGKQDAFKSQIWTS